MRKFSFVLLPILLILAILGSTYYIFGKKDSGTEKISVSDAFNSSGAKMIVNDLYFFVRAPGEYKTLNGLSEICDEVFKALGITNYSRHSNSSDNLVKTDMQGVTQDGVKITAMASIVRTKTGDGDRYISVDATEAGAGKALLLRDKIDNVFKSHSLKSEVNSCITGTYEGNLSDTQLENICRKILKESSAQKVDSFRQQNTISVSAFSPILGDKLRVGGKNVNLSLAIRYNKLENRTYLWVATPVVNAEY
ncbi:MAG TPA: YwmB family TATA-box binding protein [Ruminiclostridium sp.]|nr:YwmB family TATA-box binding protein [Ruminiclostridium sp.]